MATLADVLALLPRHVPAGAGYLAHCPAHQDRSRSLSVAPGRREGYVLLHCFAGCDRGAILAHLGLADEPGKGAAAPPAPPAVLTTEQLACREALRRHPGWFQQDGRLLWNAEILASMFEALAANLQDTATQLPPALDTTWSLVALAANFEHEARLLRVALG